MCRAVTDMLCLQVHHLFIVISYDAFLEQTCLALPDRDQSTPCALPGGGYVADVLNVALQGLDEP